MNETIVHIVFGGLFMFIGVVKYLYKIIFIIKNL